MGIIGFIRSILGTRAQYDAMKPADPDALFGITTAYIDMNVAHDFVNGTEAALCFSSVDTVQFEKVVDEAENHLPEDNFSLHNSPEVISGSNGYNWVAVHNDDFDRLVQSVYYSADAFIHNGFGSRLLAALFHFKKDDTDMYWVYSFRRGSFYAFCPDVNRTRNESIETTLENEFEGHLTIEQDDAFKHPFWTDGRDKYVEMKRNDRLDTEQFDTLHPWS